MYVLIQFIVSLIIFRVTHAANVCLEIFIIEICPYKVRKEATIYVLRCPKYHATDGNKLKFYNVRARTEVQYHYSLRIRRIQFS